MDPATTSSSYIGFRVNIETASDHPIVFNYIVVGTDEKVAPTTVLEASRVYTGTLTVQQSAPSGTISTGSSSSPAPSEPAAPDVSGAATQSTVPAATDASAAPATEAPTAPAADAAAPPPASDPAPAAADTSAQAASGTDSTGVPAPAATDTSTAPPAALP